MPGKNLPCFGQFLRCPLTGRMEAGGVGIFFTEAGQHGLQGSFTHGGGGRIVCVDVHLYFLLFLSFYYDIVIAHYILLVK